MGYKVFLSTDDLTWAEALEMVQTLLQHLNYRERSYGECNAELAEEIHKYLRELLNQRTSKSMIAEERDVLYIIIKDLLDSMLELSVSNPNYESTKETCFICGDHSAVHVCSEHCATMARAIRYIKANDYLKGIF